MAHIKKQTQRLFLIAGLLLLPETIIPAPQARVQESPGRQTKLPPVPRGVTELFFSDFFLNPVGPRGLELTHKLQSLHRQKVRLLGYMVQQDHGLPGRFIVSPFPAQVHEHDNALAEDLPSSIVHVHVPYMRDQLLPYTPGPMLLTGTLSVGNQPEPDGRISIVRLILDPPRKKPTKLQSPKNLN